MLVLAVLQGHLVERLSGGHELGEVGLAAVRSIEEEIQVLEELRDERLAKYYQCF